MKTFFTLVLLFVMPNLFAQITLYKDNAPDVAPFYLSTGKLMYYDENDSTKKITIYNEDLTVYKSINYPNNPIDTTLYSAGDDQGVCKIDGLNGFGLWMHDTYFNTDAKIEFIFSYSRYKPSNYEKKTELFILNEDGNTLLTLSIGSIDESVYLLGYSNYLVLNASSSIYKVGGTFPCNLCGSGKPSGLIPTGNSNTGLKLGAFPNPNSGKATLEYELPAGAQKGSILMYDMEGRLAKEIQVKENATQIELNTTELQSGTYFYELQSQGKSSGGKKMVIIK